MSPTGPSTWVQPPQFVPPRLSLIGCANFPPDLPYGQRWEPGTQYNPEWGNGSSSGYDPSTGGTIGQILAVTTVAQATTTATITTATPHNLRAGEGVTLFGVSVSPSVFNGDQVVLATPSPTTFTFAVPTGTVASTPATGSAIGTGEGTVAVAPFAVTAYGPRPTIGYSRQDYWVRAIRRLRVTQYSQVEAEFWNSTIVAANPSLVDNAALAAQGSLLSAPGAAVSPTMALGSLEEAGGALGIGCLFLHCSPRVFAALSRYRLVSADGPLMMWPDDSVAAPDGLQLQGGPDIDEGSGQWYITETLQAQNPGAPMHAPVTAKGNVVVGGDGYTGLGPAVPSVSGRQAVTATSEWMYASGPVDVRMDQIRTFPDSLAEATDRNTNTVLARADRNVVTAFDPATVLAIQVDLTDV